MSFFFGWPITEKLTVEFNSDFRGPHEAGGAFICAKVCLKMENLENDPRNDESQKKDSEKFT